MAPCRVLLVEDNPVNQRLALTLLRRMGHDAALATNGREAIAAAGAGFDVILMDIQMPEVDGVEATKRIRAAERDSGRHTPIIAMTAHAMAGAREEYLAAGMDDYVVKPIDPQRLRAAIHRAVSPAPQAPRAPASPAPTPAVAGPEHVPAEDIDARQLATLAAVLPADEMHALVTAYVDAAVDRLERIRQRAAAADLAALAREAHDLKGVAGNFGAQRVAELARRLEEACRSAEPAAAALLVREIEQASTHACALLRERYLAA
jgi:CheY-like chemotaxis protein/HPt (histidine-containing phosphotransfer) domain-containing protein